jgi:hypothetical protein
LSIALSEQHCLVGAGLLAKAVCQSTLILTVRAPSRASPLHTKNPNARQHKGEPKLPFNFVVACSFFIIEGRPVVVIGSRGPLLLFLAIPIRDQEQTYFFER